MSSNSFCNYTRDLRIGLPVTDFVNHSYDYQPNWTPLAPMTIINSNTHSQTKDILQRANNTASFPCRRA